MHFKLFLKTVYWIFSGEEVDMSDLQDILQNIKMTPDGLVAEPRENDQKRGGRAEG